MNFDFELDAFIFLVGILMAFLSVFYIEELYLKIVVKYKNDSAYSMTTTQKINSVK